jgi:phosphatidylinositol alpha-1,6-mannosyltransferase
VTVRHLLVTNDFPPKVGGIQSYLWELWRRLPADRVVVHTTPYRDADRFDAAQPWPISRCGERVLRPTRGAARRVDRLAREAGADLVVLDPALPLGAIGPHLRVPYALVLHGAEVTVPARLPGTAALLARVLRGASVIIAAGGYPAAEARRLAGDDLPITVVPPGVDVERFRPLADAERRAARARFGLPAHDDARLVVGVSRLVPRKGFDVLVRAAADLARTRPEVSVAIAGAGRERARLERLVADTVAPVSLLGRVPDADLPELYGCADVFAMLCHDRWGGLEAEGFGIVFLEAAAAGVPSVAGRSGGAHEAVEHGVTGTVVDRAADPVAAARALAPYLDDPAFARRQGRAARQRAAEQFSYDLLAARLGSALGATSA